MKKHLLAALFAAPLVISLASGSAQAQSWTVDGPFKDEFAGCTRLGSGQVQCVMKSTYIGNTAMYYGATFLARDSAAYAPDQKRFIAVSSSLNGRDVTNNESLNISRAAPVVVAYTFNYPAQFDQIKLLFLDTGMLKDVPIKGGAAAPASASTGSANAGSSGAAPKPVATLPKPVASTPKPAAAPTEKPAATSSGPSATLNLAAIDIKLSDCKPNSQGGYVCDKAEITPRR